MRKNLTQRLLQAVIVLAGVTLLIFVMLRIVPGNPIETMMGEHADAATVARMTAELGLDQPLYIQFFRYISSAVRGDFGTSYSLGKPVSQLMGSAFVNTLILAVFAALFAWIVGIACGICSAMKKNRLPDRLFMGFSLLGISLPVFMAAMFLQYIFAFQLKWVPISGTDSWAGFILPAIAMGWNSAGQVGQMTRRHAAGADDDDGSVFRLAVRRRDHGDGLLHQRDRTPNGAGDLRPGYPSPAGNGPAGYYGRDPRQPAGGQPVFRTGSPDPEGGLR